MNLKSVPTQDLLEELRERLKQMEEVFSGNKKQGGYDSKYSQFTEPSTWEQR